MGSKSFGNSFGVTMKVKSEVVIYMEVNSKTSDGYNGYS